MKRACALVKRDFLEKKTPRRVPISNAKKHPAVSPNSAPDIKIILSFGSDGLMEGVAYS